jgi:assimilatory nitrate reductase catalytic subunit
LTVGQIFRFAESIHKGSAVSFWWTMGVNQGHESTRTAQAIINLALMTGNIGRPGTGANSITGQCNAMGSRLFSNTTSLLGGRDFLNDEHRKEVADVLGINVDRIPRQNSLAYDQIIDCVREGRIKGLWIVATNTAHSWIDKSDLCKSFEKLDLLVVQDMYHTTETARLAHLLLPAAGWGEKDGTLINSERRIGLVKKVATAPGEALSDFKIFRLVANYWGCEHMFERWRSPEAVFQILKELSRGRPCDVTGIENYQMLDACGGIQWPWAEKSPRSKVQGPKSGSAERAGFSDFGLKTERRLFEDGRFFTPDGRARFLFDQPVEAPELGGGEYPFTLLTGRGTSAQWHTNTRTGKSAVLRQLYPANIYVEVNPEDARRLHIHPQQLVEVVSRRGRLVASAYITSTVQAGQVFIPMHYEETNRLTYPAFDPHSRQPSYKACAVTLVPIKNGRSIVPK